MNRKTYVLAVITLCLLGNPLVADASRFALVVGNSSYSFGFLKNPKNDAIDISKALQEVGFKVDTLIDVNKRQFIDSVESFSRKIGPDDVAMFFYAGHAIQVDNINYLLSVGESVRSEVQLDDIGVDLQFVMQKMERADMSIVVLDACRVNPYSKYYISENNGKLTRDFRGIGLRPKAGLAGARRSKGTFIAYATDIGSVAYDGDGRNGIFTKHILKNIKKPGYRLEDVFKRVREGVAQETGDSQIPWDSSSITGVFYFVPPQDRVIYQRDRNAFVPAF